MNDDCNLDEILAAAQRADELQLEQDFEQESRPYLERVAEQGIVLLGLDGSIASDTRTVTIARSCGKGPDEASLVRRERYNVPLALVGCFVYAPHLFDLGERRLRDLGVTRARMG